MSMIQHGRRGVMVLSAVIVGCAVDAVGGWRSSESDLAAPGAALYQSAVAESVKSLLSKQEQAVIDAANRPPSPGPDYFWCDNCKTYHKRQTPAAAGAIPNGSAPATPTPGPHASPVTANRPPAPGPDMYWCEQCKTYHRRQALPNQPGAALQGSPGLAPPAAVPATPAQNSRPAPPGEGYYWCDQCQTYHLRTPEGQVLSASAAAAALGIQADQLPDGEYYYCDKCKTYHRRQVAAPHPEADLDRILRGGSTRPNPLSSPAESH
jgi:hypothetical protein